MTSTSFFGYILKVSLLLSLVLLSGCSFSPVNLPGMGFWDSGELGENARFVKKVGVMPLRNSTVYQDEDITKPLSVPINTALTSKCSKIDFITPSDPSVPDFLLNPPETSFGDLDPLAMARKSRELGINMVIAATVTDIHYEAETSWYNWLVDDDDVIFLNIRVEIFDTHTGAKVYHNTLMETKKIKSLNKESLSVPEIMNLPDFPNLSSQIIQTLSQEICKTLHAQPWKGFFLSVDGKQGVLSSGSAAGLKVKDVLEVYKNEGKIKGYGGLEYIIPGSRVDRVRVTQVTKNRAHVESVSGKNLADDYIVRF